MNKRIRYLKPCYFCTAASQDMISLLWRAQKKLRAQSFSKDLAYRTTSWLFRQPACSDCISPCALAGTGVADGAIICLGLKIMSVLGKSWARGCVSALSSDSIFSEFPGVIFDPRQSLLFLRMPRDG